MKHLLKTASLLIAMCFLLPSFGVMPNDGSPHKGFLLLMLQKSHNKLFALSNDEKNCFSIGLEHSFLKCD